MNYHDTHKLFLEYIYQRILNENNIIINRIIDNLDYWKYILLHLKTYKINQNYNDILMEKLFNAEDFDSLFKHKINEDIYLSESLENLLKLDNLKGKEYKNMYDKVISVDEINIRKSN